MSRRYSATATELLRVRESEPGFLRVVAEEALVAQMARERAEACWTRLVHHDAGEASWWSREEHVVVVEDDTPGGCWMVRVPRRDEDAPGIYLPYHTEDEALAAALELRDVALS